jgi:hypothetical protein
MKKSQSYGLLEILSCLLRVPSRHAQCMGRWSGAGGFLKSS